MDTLPQMQDVASGLAPHVLFRSRDLDETRDGVGRVFKPHALGVCGVRQRLDARMDHLPLGAVSVSRLRYGADVSIEPGPLETFLLVQMPLRGMADIACGLQTLRSTPALASVLTPSWPLSMRWHASCDQLIIRINRAALEDACAGRLGQALPRPLAFDVGMDLRRSGGLAWRQLTLCLAAGGMAAAATAYPLVGTQIEQLLVAMLLDGQPHNYSDALRRPAVASGPAYIHRAEAYIEAHCDEPITLDMLAREVCTSARSLQAGFRDHRGTTPMAFLKRVRLQRVREALLRARADGAQVSVTAVALTWGFAHLGHFTAAYQKQFGELPSQTLRG